MIFDIHGNQLSKIPKKIGTVFFIGTMKPWNLVPYRRKRGLLVTARRGMDPTLRRAFMQRWRRRVWRQ